jgi:uncharacterized protein (DUF433 family)
MTIERQTLTYDRLNRALYSFAEADRLAGVTPGTSRRWLKGYHYWYSPEERRKSPPITPHSESKEGVSFIDLVEVIVAGRLRDRDFSLKRIRQINEYCQLALSKPRPLVTETFKTSGRDVFIMAGRSGYLLNVLYQAGMQAWDEVLDPFLKDLDYEDEIARRWWPKGKAEPIVIDPDYGFGLPVIAGSGVRTEILAERYEAGDTNEEIAYDFGVAVPQVEAAIRYEMPEAA